MTDEEVYQLIKENFRVCLAEFLRNSPVVMTDSVVKMLFDVFCAGVNLGVELPDALKAGSTEVVYHYTALKH
jgi:hypothetical protein